MRRTIATGIVGVTVFAVLIACAENIAESTQGFNNVIPDQIMTPDKVATRLGDLKFIDGVPDQATVQKVYDNLDFIRGVDVFLNFIPATSIEGMRLGHAELGAINSSDVLIFNNLMDSNALFLTGNTDTVYASAMLDLEKDGATVIEIPQGAGPGTVNDAFFRFVVDMGAPGPDRKKGGTYIILPPDYQGDLKPTPNTFQDNSAVSADVGGEMKDVWIAQSTSYTNWVILRGFLVDGKPDGATEMWESGLRIYPLSKAGSPPKMDFMRVSGRQFNTIHANNFEFYEELATVLQKEPVSFIDPELRGQAAAIGIVKGTEFSPDARMQEILEDAVAVGNATARAIMFYPRDSRTYLFKNSQWTTFFVGGDYRWLDGDGKRGRNLDARTLFFYQATVNTPAMALQIPGVGSNYAGLTKDKNGDILYGDKNYKINIPVNVPAKDFWSIVLYDPQTRSELQTSQPFPSINNKIAKLTYNENGSVDLYFGPDAPAGMEANWIATAPGKGWFLVLRLYGPLEPWFKKTWQPGELELVE
jgi:hypothetical protein